MVRAYKGLAKEKETLETSLATITAAVVEEQERGSEADTDSEAASAVAEAAVEYTAPVVDAVGTVRRYN